MQQLLVLSTMAIASLMEVHCGVLGPEDRSSLFVAKVDSLTTAETVAVRDTLSIRFWGTLGPDTRYTFSHFEVKQEQTGVEFRLWGKYTPSAVAGPSVQDLRGVEYRVVPSQSGGFTISVRQPDGSRLSRGVTVE